MRLALLSFAMLTSALAAQVPSAPTGITVSGPQPQADSAKYVIFWQGPAAATGYHLRIVKSPSANPLWPADYPVPPGIIYHQFGDGLRAFDTVTFANPVPGDSVGPLKVAIRSCATAGCGTFAVKTFYVKPYVRPPAFEFGIRITMLASIGCTLPLSGSRACGPWPVFDDSGHTIGHVSVTVSVP